MNPSQLITMANQIGAFFETMPDRAQALADIATHIKLFWDPRMRQGLLAHIDHIKTTHNSIETEHLSDMIMEAVALHRDRIL